MSNSPAQPQFHQFTQAADQEVWQVANSHSRKHLGRGVVMVVVRLIVFIPLVARVHAVEVLGLPWPVLLVPPVYLRHKSICICLEQWTTPGIVNPEMLKTLWVSQEISGIWRIRQVPAKHHHGTWCGKLNDGAQNMPQLPLRSHTMMDNIGTGAHLGVEVDLAAKGGVACLVDVAHHARRDGLEAPRLRVPTLPPDAPLSLEGWGKS